MAYNLFASAFAFASAVLSAGDFAWPGAEAVDAQELSSLDHTQRQRAAERLALRGGPEMRAGLISLLDDPAAGVRSTAARLLAQQGVPEAIESATRWTISATPTNRRLGLDILRDVPGPLPAAALRAIERSLSDGDVTVRLLAIDALAQQKDVAPSLLPIAAASEDDSREVRLRATRVLAASRDRRAVVPLLARLADVDRQVRVEAIGALAAIGDPRTAPALKRQLSDLADDVRGAAALALGKLAIADAVPAIAALMRRPPSDEVSRRAALALGNIASPEAIAALMARLREPPLPDEVAAGLLRAGPIAIPALRAEALRGTATSSTAAVTLLGKLRAGAGGADPEVNRTLAEVVARRGSAAGAAIAALAAIKDPESLPVLLDAATDALAETRRAAYAALIAIGDDRALIALERGLADPDAQVRALALRLGASLGPPHGAGLAAMAARLGDPDPAVNREAIAALVRLGRRIPATVAPLLSLLARAPADAAIGDALEIMAGPGDDDALVKAARRLPAEARAAIARALAAAHAAHPIEDGALTDLLLGMLPAGGVEAEAAADALAGARARGRESAVLRAFDAAEPEVRPRLCAALGALGGSAGRERLIGLVGGANEPTPVRAAAAWALAAAPEPRRDELAAAAALRFALTRAATSPEPALAANARAALAAAPVAGRPDPRARSWAGVRLLAPDGAARPHEWLSLIAADGTTVWTWSGLDGAARIYALPPGPYQVRLPNPTLTLRTALSPSPAPRVQEIEHRRPPRADP